MRLLMRAQASRCLLQGNCEEVVQFPRLVPSEVRQRVNKSLQEVASHQTTFELLSFLSLSCLVTLSGLSSLGSPWERRFQTRAACGNTWDGTESLDNMLCGFGFQL